MGLAIVTPPASEPVTTSEAKSHLVVENTNDDTLIDGMVQAAREFAETFTHRQVMPATWRLSLDGFPTSGVIVIPRPPLSSISSIKYDDTDGIEQTVSSSVYTVDTVSLPGRVWLAYDQVWPTPRDIPNSVRVEFVAGYADAATVPERIKMAIKQLVTHWYEVRGPTSPVKQADVPFAVSRLLSQFVVHSFGDDNR